VPSASGPNGASKRGWTSWLTAVADTRVKAVLPEVYDNLNLFAQMPHQVKMWDAYSEMIDDYTEQRLQDKMRTPRGRQMALVLDLLARGRQVGVGKQAVGSNGKAALAALRVPPPEQAKLTGQR